MSGTSPLVERVSAGMDIRTVMETVLSDIGGAEGLGHLVGDDVRRVRGLDLTEKEREEFRINEKIVLEQTKFIANTLMQVNRIEQENGIQNIPEEKLYEMMLPLMLVRIEQDSEFRAMLLEAVMRADPEAVLQKLASMPLLPEGVDVDAG